MPKSPHIVTTVLKPNVVLASVYTTLIPNDKNLVVAKEDGLEIFSVRNGLELTYQLPLYGVVNAMIPVSLEKDRSSLLVTTYSRTIHLIRYTGEGFETFNSDMRPTQILDQKHLVAASSHYAAVVMEQGYIKVIKLKSNRNGGSQHIEEMLSGTMTYDMAFVKPLDIQFVETNKLAVLFRDGNQTRISFLTINANVARLLPIGKSVLVPKAAKLMPVDGGAVIAVGKRLSFVKVPQKDEVPAVTKLRDVHEQFTVWTKIDDKRYLLGTVSGSLYLLSWQTIEALATTDSKFELREVAESSVFEPNALIHISSNYFFASSTQTASALFTVDVDHNSLSVVQQLECTGAITDVIYEEKYGSQNIVIGSKSGKISVLRRGRRVDLELELEVEGVRNMWAVGDDCVVLSGTGFTLPVSIGENSDQVQLDGIDETVESIAVGTLDGQVVQVTTCGAGSYKAAISLAIFSSDALYCCEGKHITKLDGKLNIANTIEVNGEIAALSATSTKLAIARWNSSTIELYDARTLNAYQQLDTGLDSVIRSLVIMPQKIYAGSADGQLFIDFAGEQRLIQVGSKPLALTSFNSSALAWSDTAFIPSVERDTGIFNVTNLDMPVPVCAAKVGPYVAYATETKVSIGKPSAVTTLISDIDVASPVVKLCKYKSVYIVCTMDITQGGSIVLLDQNFDKLDTMEFDTSMPTCIEVVESETFDGFVVGLSEETTDTWGKSEGKLMLFTIKNGNFYLHHALKTKSNVLDVTFSGPEFTVPSVQFLASLGEVVRAVTIYREDIQQDFKMKLLDLPREFKSTTITNVLDSYKHRVIAGDVTRAVQYLRFEPGEGFKQLEVEGAVEPGMTTSASLRAEGFVYGTNDGWLFLEPTTTSGENAHLFQLFAVPTAIRAIDCNTKREAATPEYLFTTSNGGIFTISRLSDSSADAIESAYSTNRTTRLARQFANVNASKEKNGWLESGYLLDANDLEQLLKVPSLTGTDTESTVLDVLEATSLFRQRRGGYH